MLGKLSLVLALLFLVDVCLGNLFPLNGRIVNGTVASIVGNEHQVSLRLRKRDFFFGSGFICGGSLIAKNAVLTAAHCIYDLNNARFRRADEFVVAMGSVDRFDMDNSYKFDVTHYAKMPTFDISTYQDDLAILFLDKYVPNDAPTVKIIDLETKPVKPGTECKVTGWGEQGGDLGTSMVLMTANVPILPDNLCRENYEDTFRDGMLCAGYMSGQIDSCKGDSGGPFVCNNKLVGVVSTGFKCALPGYPGLYTNVSYPYHRTWILQNLRKNPRIKPTVDTSFQVSIRLRSEDFFFGRGHICSGTLLSNESVLTSASCLYDFDNSKFRQPEEFVIAMGVTNIYDPEQNPTEYELKNYTILPGFNAADKANDMAIIFLDIARSNNSKILKIQNYKLPTGTQCYVTGWGLETDDHSNENIASVEVSVVKDLNCPNVTGSICTAFVKDGTAGCSIDAGSPLVCGGKVAGVAVKGLGCDNGGLSNTVFTGVENNKKWIKKIVGGDSACLTDKILEVFESLKLSMKKYV